jgi:ribosomal protein S18 acetylase RimI-like enzyme
MFHGLASKNASDDYQGNHRPGGPSEEEGDAPAHQVDKTFPDFYEKPHLYDHHGSGGLFGGARTYPQTVQTLRRVRGNPEAPVTMYRSLPPEHAHKGFNTGDWVSIHPDYARGHGLHETDEKEDWPVIKATVPAKHLWNNGDMIDEFGYHGPAVKGEIHFPGGENAAKRLRKEGRFTPDKRVFTSTCGLDHRLFEKGGHLKTDVRKYIMSSIAQMWGSKYPTWSQWAIVYFAGSEASEWTSPELEGNNDFDVLVGVDFEHFLHLNPQYRTMTDDEIAAMFNEGFRHFNGPVTLTVEGHKFGPFARTTYVNPLAYDIRKIKPYAAYNVSDDTWTVKPPHLPHWSLSELPRAVQQVLRAASNYAHHVLSLPEPERTQQGAALFDSWHSDRSRAFSDKGEGWWDIANLREKWLDQEGIWSEIVGCKHRAKEGLDAAPVDWSNMPKFSAASGFSGHNQFLERLDKGPEEEPYLHGRRDEYAKDVTTHTGHNYTLMTGTHIGFGGNTQVTAHRRLSNGKYQGAGYLSWFGGNPDKEGRDGNTSPGTIYKVHVAEQHRRRGLASAMLDFARERYPEMDIRHSTALTEDGRSWAEKKASNPNVPYYHATHARLKPGDQLQTATARGHNADHHGPEEAWRNDRVWMTKTPALAHRWAEDQGKTPHVYEVRPTNDVKRHSPEPYDQTEFDAGGGQYHAAGAEIVRKVPLEEYAHKLRRWASRATDAVTEVGKREHPNVDHYRSGGMGHLPGDESKSVVGFMPTEKLFGYEGNPTHDREVVRRVSDDIKSGKGITNPLMMIYDHKNRWAYLGEGNHRLEGATEAGARTVPVRFVRGNAEYEKSQGIGRPMHLGESPWKGGMGEDYIPTDIHPHHFLKTSTVMTENRHWGAGLDSLFPHDEDGPKSSAMTPWAAAGQSKERKSYDEDLVARSITHPHEFPVEDVDPRDLRATQPKVIRAGVQHYMNNSSGKTYGEDNGGDRRLGNDMPRIYHREDGQKIILSGHHRAAAALLKGEPLRAIVIRGPWGAARRAA